MSRKILKILFILFVVLLLTINYVYAIDLNLPGTDLNSNPTQTDPRSY